MKRYVGVIIAVVGVAASAFWAMKKSDEKAAAFRREQSLTRLKSDYLERSASVRNAADERAYKSEIATLMGWYFKEIAEHQKQHGGNRDFDDYLVELEQRSKKGAASKYDDSASAGKDRSDEKRAAYEYTKKIFDVFKSGNYAPYWTAGERGIRLDILSANTMRIGAEEKIHLPLVVWGLPREERTDERKVTRVTVNAAFRMNWKLFDEKQKLVAEMPVDGGPDGRIDWPDRYIRLFPPMVVLGTYNIDKLPASVKTAEITISISGRSATGGDVSTNFVWKLDVPAEWKLAEGETWSGATESVRSPEEIDPSKRK